MTAPVVDSVLDLIGSTPVVRLDRVISDPSTRKEVSAEIWAKCEHMNPGGSLKDRPCAAMIDRAEQQGLLHRGDLVVEATSGNTGIGLALVCAQRGHRLLLTMPRSMSLERRALLEAYGAELVLTDPERGMEGAVDEALRIASERKAFVPRQFENPANPDAHWSSTAIELLDAFDRIDAFVMGVGTGGTVTGVGRRLRERDMDTTIIAVEPHASPVLAGGSAGPTKIQGMNNGFIPENYDPAVVDEVRSVRDHDAWTMKQKLAREEGLLVGISAGANVHVAATVARELGPGNIVVTVLCDTGERYFSLDQHFQSASENEL